MMWHKVLLMTACMTAFGLPEQAVAEADHTLSIDGTVIDLPMNEDVVATLKDGRSVTLRLALKPLLSYTAKGVRFQYPSGMSVSSREIDPGITQHMVATATGTLLILQTYDDIDTTTLVDLMTGKMTDDDVAAGATRDTQPHSRRLADGTDITGTLTHLKATRDDVLVEVLAKRQGKGGALLITRHDRLSSPEDNKLIDIFWRSVQLD